MAKKTAKKAARKSTASKKKATKKKPAAKKKATGKSIRLKTFELLNKKPNGLTGRQIKEALGLSTPPHILTDEAEIGRVLRVEVEGQRGVTYKLSAKGKTALKAGKVDSDAPSMAEMREKRAS